MEHYGLNVSSDADFVLHFRTLKNTNETLFNIRKVQNFLINNYKTLKQDITLENNAPFIFLQTNLAERPLKLLLDTGASISIISSCAISKNIERNKYIVNLFGITGKENSVKTEGIVHGISLIDDCMLGTSFHLIDKKYAGPADGYLGFDFLSQYGCIINLKSMRIEFRLNNIVSSKNDEILNEKIKANKSQLKGNIEKIENFKNEKENDDYKMYFEAVKYYEEEFSHIPYDSETKRILRMINENTENAEQEMPIVKEKSFTIETNHPDRPNFIYDELKLDHCIEEEKQNIKLICQSFPYQFFVEGDSLNSTDILKHTIKTIPNSKPVYVRQYKIPHHYKEILKNIIEDYERQGIIEKCMSNYNSPLILIEKPDAGNKTNHRLVVDFRKLNEIIEFQTFPIPLIDNILDGLGGCSFFTTLDIKGAFHQIVLDDSSRDYTAFTAGNFQYRWVRMPMGLSTAPLTWQRAINTILIDLIGQGVYVYLDDIIIYAKSRKEHDSTLFKVMSLLKEHNLQLKISKCLFYARQFDYLGHVITEKGIKANPKKIEVIKNFPQPIKVKHIQSFLGICSYFRRYVKNYSHLSKPLTMLLKKEQPFIWTQKQQQCFDALKKALCEEVTLAFPDFDQLFYVTTDASDIAIGAMLSQGELPNDRPVYFFSKTLNDTQKRYSTIQKELLAIVESIKQFRIYLYGRFFILITDHKPLCYLFNMKDCGSRLFRQKLEILNYNFKILYRPGAQNHVADGLSRIEPLTIDEMLDINKEEKQCHVLTRNQARNELNKPPNDTDFIIEERNGTVLNKRGFDLIFHLVPLENDTLKNKIMNKFGTTVFDKYFKKINNYNYVCLISNQFSHREKCYSTYNCITEIFDICMENNAEHIAINIDFDNIRHYIFFKTEFQNKFKNSNISVVFFLNKIVEIKESDDIQTILNTYHKSLLGGHFGVEKMFKTISRFYTWDNMLQNIKDYIKKCAVCEKIKTTTNTKVPMHISSLGECLFDHTFIDFVGPISPISSDGHKYIFTATCDLTKFMIAIPTFDCTALTTAECLTEHIFLKYNIPSRLISDNASSFNSQVIKELNNLFKVRKIFTTPYHPQSNIVERCHRTLNAYLRAFTAKNRDLWHHMLKYATFAYNNSIHSTTGYTPHELAHGFKIQIPTNLTKQKTTYNYDNLADNTRNNIAKALELAKEHIQKKKLINKKYYDSNANNLIINPNDLVLVKSQTKKEKFQDVYEGPYRVLDSSDEYVEIMRKGKRAKVHKNLIKKSIADHDEEPPSQIPIIPFDNANTEIEKIYSIDITHKNKLN